MIILSLTDILLCLAVTVIIGFGGFYIGHQRGYDLGERDHRAWCTKHHMTRPAAAELDPRPFMSTSTGTEPDMWIRPFQGAQDPVYGLPGRHAATEPDTAPLRALVTRAAGVFHRQVTQAMPATPGACLPVAELDPDVAQMIERNQFEVQQLINRAERMIGGFTYGQEIQG